MAYAGDLKSPARKGLRVRSSPRLPNWCKMKLIELGGNSNSKHFGLFENKFRGNWMLFFHVRKDTNYLFHLDIGPIHLLISSDLKRYQVITPFGGKIVYPKERSYI